MNGYRLASKAYPADYWADNGEEIIAVANDSSGGRWSLRQAGSLVAGGLRARVRLATGSSERGVWESGVRVALLISLALSAGVSVARAMGWGWWTDPISLLEMSLLLAALAVMTRGTGPLFASFITGYLALSTWGTVTDHFSSTELLPMWAFAAGPAMLTVAAWWLALTTDHTRVARPVTVLGLITLFTIGAVNDGFMLWWLLGLMLTAVVLVRSDPRLMAAVAVVAGVQLVSAVPYVFLNDDTGLRFWGPVGISIAIMVIPVVLVRWGSRRMIAA